jgi:hypothetical protein
MPMGQALPGVLARSAARQVYRLLRLSAPLLRPLYHHIGIEQRARMVTALVRIGWNGAAVTSPLGKDSEIVAPERLTAGVACIGHPTAESGVGEALRGTARALQAAGVPFTLLGLDSYTTARLEDRSLAAHESPRLGARANLLCDGLIGADIAVRALGAAAFAGRTNILRPFWELAKVPSRFADTLDRFQEIWAPSEFVRSSFAEATNVPVFRVPVPVEVSPIAPVSRSQYGLPAHATLFLFAFDPCLSSPARIPSPWSKPFIRPSAIAATPASASSSRPSTPALTPPSSRRCGKPSAATAVLICSRAPSPAPR